VKRIALSPILIALVAFAVSASAQAPPKQPGVVRIGIVQPQLRMGSESSPEAAKSVRQTLAAYLRGPTIEVALLGARLASQYAIEAARVECDFVLAVSVTHERRGMNDVLGRGARQPRGTCAWFERRRYVGRRRPPQADEVGTRT
jgi:hypothetical protein